ncbi:unnamed protein product [Oikopleura dioica]|uniref:Uncharacterized protein n=1 Tax=Oikopleura dioica TaxID=34765 RepID=E4Y6B8_OIKDI|nr:unnamed protein product [Oikopleura dioica]
MSSVPEAKRLRSSSPNASTGSFDAGYSGSPLQIAEKSDDDARFFSEEEFSEKEEDNKTDEESSDDDVSDDDYVPEPEVKQEPGDFWDEGSRATPAPNPKEIPKADPEPAEEPVGGRGKAMRERMRQIRMQKLQKEGNLPNPKDDEMHLQDYKDALAAHEREEELSKKRKFALDSSEEEEYYEKIEKKRVPGEARRKKEPKQRKLRLTKSHLPYYSNDQIIDLTSLDCDFSNPEVKNEAENVEPQVKEEIPGPRDRVTGFESVLHNRQVTERNLEMIFNSIGPKRVRLYAIDDLVTVFNASVKPESLRRKEDVRDLTETRITMILSFQMKYNTVKRRTMIFPLGLCYSANNLFLINPLLQRFNSWLADKSDKGARNFLLSSAAAKKEAVKMPFVLEAGKITHKFFNEKLISEEQGLKSGLALASMLRVKISDLERTATVESLDKLQRDISTRFNFAVDADDDLRASFRANKKVIAIILLKCKGKSMACQTDCGHRPELFDFPDEEKIIKEERICPNCGSCLIINPSHVRCKFALRLVMTADRLNKWQIHYPVRNNFYHTDYCPGSKFLKKLVEDQLREMPDWSEEEENKTV